MSVCCAIPAQAQQESLRHLSGFSLGAFQIRPTAAFENVYNDNIFATDGGGVDDYLLAILPGLEIESDWSRHSVSVIGAGRLTRYASETAEDNDQYAIDATGRLDLPHESNLAASVSGGRRTVGRTNVENNRRTDPEQLDFVTGELRFDRRLDRFDLELLGAVKRLDFRESANADRDRTGFGGSSRLSYRFSPALSLFLQPLAEVLDYDERVDDDGSERSSVAIEGYAGAAIDIASILEAEISVGAIHIAFDETSFDDVTTLGVRGELTWDVTRLTRLEADVIRGLSPTSQDGASSKTETQASFGVRHQLFRSVKLGAEFRYQREKFRGLGRTDHDYRVRASAGYQLNRFLAIDLEYRYRVRDSNAAREDFRSNVVALTFELRL